MFKDYSKEDIRKFLIAYHHLADAYALPEEDIVKYIEKVGCIQFDPLDVVGKNPDLVLQSRVKDYRKSYIENLLYRDRQLFDVWDKNMSICSVKDWPHFYHFRRRFDEWCVNHKTAIEQITEYLQENDYACSSDFDMEDKVRWHYGPQRLAKATLECMCYAGIAIVHHKVGTRRYYGLAEKYLPNAPVGQSNLYIDRDEYDKSCTLRRINGVGVLWNKGSDAWLGLYGYKKENRDKAFKSLLDEYKITEIQVKDMKQPLYISTENLALLNSMAGQEIKEYAARIIAPLDNLMWDRKLIESIFGFAYKWEVYTPAEQRKYGYYVLPLLYNYDFIGRIELSVDKNENVLNVQNIWMEGGKAFSDYSEVIMKCLDRFSEFCNCRTYRFCRK